MGERTVEQVRTNLLSVLPSHTCLFAYLFGSMANNRSSRLSDIDIALFLNPSLPKEECFDIQLLTTAKLDRVIEDRRADILILNDAPLRLKFRVLKDGILLFSFDEMQRVQFEMQTYLSYFDFQWIELMYTKVTLEG